MRLTAEIKVEADGERAKQIAAALTSLIRNIAGAASTTTTSAVDAK